MSVRRLRHTVVALGACLAVAAPSAVAAKKPVRVKLDNYSLKGQVQSVDSATNTAVVTVTKSNKAGRVFRGASVTLDMSATRVRFSDDLDSAITDGDGDGDVDLADVVAGDRADFDLRLPRRLTAAPAGPQQPRKVTFKRPELETPPPAL